LLENILRAIVDHFIIKNYESPRLKVAQPQGSFNFGSCYFDARLVKKGGEHMGSFYNLENTTFSLSKQKFCALLF
jgi:hypothetical protein